MNKNLKLFIGIAITISILVLLCEGCNKRAGKVKKEDVFEISYHLPKIYQRVLQSKN